MRRNNRKAYLYLLPAAVVLTTFWVWPLLHAFNMSVHTNWARGAPKFVGLANYERLLVGGEFWRSIAISGWYVLGTVPAGLVLSFLIANLLFQKLRARGLFRTIYFLPYVTSTVAAAMVWRWIFAPGTRGAANTVLGWFGLDPQRWYVESAGIFTLLGEAVGIAVPEWAGGPSLALVCVMVFSIWHMLGFNTVIFLAGLSAIPSEMYEAAEVNGATGRQRLWYVTVPLLSPTVFFLTVVSIIRSFQTFNQIYVMTAEESVGSTETLTMLIFNLFYGASDYGAATAVAVLLFFIILGLTVLQFRFIGPKVHY
jgi:multiple sugar transport system permease protein